MAGEINDPGLVDWMTNLIGGAATTLVGASLGRLMWHTGEVKKGQRQFFGPELLWEIPVALGMAVIGEAIAGYMGASSTVTTGIVALAAYIGPRGAEVILTKWLTRAKQ